MVFQWFRNQNSFTYPVIADGLGRRHYNHIRKSSQPHHFGRVSPYPPHPSKSGKEKTWFYEWFFIDLAIRIHLYLNGFSIADHIGGHSDMKTIRKTMFSPWFKMQNKTIPWFWSQNSFIYPNHRKKHCKVQGVRLP